MRVSQRQASKSANFDKEVDILPRIRYGSGTVCIGLDVGSEKRGHVVNIYLSRKDLIEMLYLSDKESDEAAIAVARHNALARIL